MRQLFVFSADGGYHMQDNKGYKPYRYFRNIRYNNFLILMDIIIILMGYYFIRYVDPFYEILPQLMGTMMLVIGITGILYSVSTREYRRTTTRDMATSIMITIVGGIITFSHEEVYGLIGISWGLFGLNRAVDELNTAISEIAHHEKGFLYPLIASVFGTVLAILLLVDPVEKVYEHMHFIGLELIFIGVDAIINNIMRRRRLHVRKKKK